MAEEVEKKLMRLKKDELVEEARKRCLEETGTKSDLVQYLDQKFILKKFDFFCFVFNFFFL